MNEERRRLAREAFIRAIDMTVYLFAFAGGVFALAVPPDTIRRQLEGFEWLGTCWGVLLLAAGALGFAGRLTRRWIVEVPGTAMAIAGELIYVVVLAATALDSATAWVALCMIAGATLALLRRYVELQILTAEPRHASLAARLDDAFHRRTTDSVGPHT